MNRQKITVSFLIVVFLLLVPSFTSAQDKNWRETPIVKVVRDNAEVVVNIGTEHIILLRENPSWGYYGIEFDLFFDQFFGLQRPRRTVKLQSVGSGVIVDSAGIIVTNAHVVHMASNIFVILNDGRSVKGKVVYENLEDDLALVRIKPPRLFKEAKLGSTHDIMIGETIVAIGNPLGLENSVTSGVVSGKDRDIFSSRGKPVMQGLLQIDAPINPGNSGGALLNLNGELIGINVAVVQNSQSIGFAVPVEKIQDALDAHMLNRDLVIKHKKRQEEKSPVSFDQEPQTSPQEDRWNPFEEIGRMRSEMNKMFHGAFDGGSGNLQKGMLNSNIFYNSNFDIQETQDKYILKVDVPGVNEKKIDIDIQDGVMTISGEHSVSEEKTGPDGYYRSQRVGSFSRTIPLPKDADARRVRTDVRDDVITITLPKDTKLMTDFIQEK